MSIEADNAVRADAVLQQAVTLHEQGRFDEAGVLYEQALKLQPKDFRAPYLLGVIALQQRRPERAVDLLGRAIRLHPQSAEAHYDLGRALAALDRHEAAIASYDRALALAPENAAIFNHRGNALYLMKKFEAALASYDRALALAPENAAIFNHRGNALYLMKKFEAALASYDRALALNPGYADAHNNRGNVLYRLKQYQPAVAAYDKALALDPGYADCFHNRGKVLNELKQYPAAIADFDRALELKCDVKALHGLRLNAKIQSCDWRNLESEIAELAARIERGEPACISFTVLAVSGSPALQQRAAELWVREHYPADGTHRLHPRRRPAKIRVGYFSADFHNHATLHLMAGLVELHDRSRFQTIAFSYGPDSRDEMRTRFEAACEDFIDVRDRSDQETARLARELEIDIAVDLKGFTRDGRLGIFAWRCAPVQVSYLGYPGTTSAPYMDYLIADRTLIPAHSRCHYSEKIIYLPHSYQVNDAKRRIADRVFTRQEVGLPPAAFVFCCFNNNYKIMPDNFDCWMRILNRVEGSVLWLFEENPTAAHNLRQEALRRKVSAERLVFAKRMMPPEHLARHRVADLFVDTLPCNAHTTASDALWAGLPVLTCRGEAFAGRVAASLLNALQLPELITATRAEYEALAVELATNPSRLAGIKQKLAAKRIDTPLFDTRLYTQHLENAYAQVYARHAAGLPPVDLYIERPSAPAEGSAID